MVLGSTATTEVLTTPDGEPRSGATRRAALASVTAASTPITRSDEQRLPVISSLEALLPDAGLRRGSVVAVDGVGSTSLLLALLVAPSTVGSWVATVGLPQLGLGAAAELGVVLERLAVVADPDPSVWSAGVAALIDAFDVVAISPRHARQADARRLTARARERGAVVILAGDRRRWAEGPDLALSVQASTWSGLGWGHGHLTDRQLTVTATGRRAFSQPRHAELRLAA